MSEPDDRELAFREEAESILSEILALAADTHNETLKNEVVRLFANPDQITISDVTMRFFDKPRVKQLVDDLTGTARLSAILRGDSDQLSSLIDMDDDDWTPDRNPPARAEAILRLVVPSARAEEIIGDMAEKYLNDCRRYGEGRAGRFYTIDAIKLIAPMLWERAKKFGVIALIIDAMRRLVS